MAKILLGTIFLAVGFKVLLGQKPTEHGKNSVAVKYQGPVVYSNLPPPVLFFPTFPDKPQMSKSNPDVQKMNKINSPLEYIPLPYHDLPVLVYHSNKNPPIHVVQKQANANPEENQKTVTTNAKYPWKNSELPNPFKYRSTSTIKKKPHINIPLVNGGNNPHHITVKLSPRAQFSTSKIVELDGQRIISINIIPLPAAQMIPMQQKYGFSNSTEEKSNLEINVRGKEQAAQSPADDAQYMAYNKRNIQASSNNDGSKQQQMNYDFKQIQMNDQAQQYKSSMQSDRQSYTKLDENEKSREINQNFHKVVQIPGRNIEQGYESMPPPQDTRQYMLEEQMQPNSKQAQMNENQMNGNYKSANYKSTASHKDLNQEQKISASPMESSAIDPSFDFMDNQKYRHIVIHIPHTISYDHPSQNQEEKREEMNTDMAKITNIMVGNFRRNAEKVNVGFQNQNYNMHEKRMPVAQHEAGNKDLTVSPTTHLVHIPNGDHHQNHRHHNQRFFTNPEITFANFVPKDHAAQESNIIANGYAFPPNFENMFLDQKVTSSPHAIPLDLSHYNPRESVLNEGNILTSSNIKPEIVDLFKDFQYFSRMGQHKSHISKRDTSLRTATSESNNNLVLRSAFENFYKQNTHGVQHFTNPGQYVSPLLYQQFILPAVELPLTQVKGSILKHTRNNIANGKKRPTSIQDYINDHNYHGQESHERHVTLATSMSQSRKPPIIIYKGIKPPVYVYGDQSKIEKPKRMKHA